MSGGRRYSQGRDPQRGLSGQEPQRQDPGAGAGRRHLLWESNAILNFLADGSELLPREPRLRTQVLQWQFFEQYSHEPFVAVARFIQFYQGLPEERRAEYERCHIDGYKRWR